MIAASIDHLSDAVELVLTGHTPARLVVFDYHPEVDDQREAVQAARDAVGEGGSPVIVETLADVLDAREGAAARAVAVPDDFRLSDPLTLLIYTSGSTGAPKGAMYPRATGRPTSGAGRAGWFGRTRRRRSLSTSCR